MEYKHILVTGGAGFIGSNLSIKLKEYYPNLRITALDNLIRKGSELNVPRLEKYGITFVKGDVRYKRDLDIKDVDFIIECSADPSVLAGITSPPEYVIDTNLTGAINCFELARIRHADIIFLSTSRIYPIDLLNNLSFKETENRFVLQDNENIKGVSKNGITEAFPLEGHRTFYGATKFSAELLLAEYIANYEVRGVINRFGVIAGSWQMGKADQGLVAYWMLQHVLGKPLRYLGFGGKGKQVRDILDIDDVFLLINYQLTNISLCNGKTFNAGGGLSNSVSLRELTSYCQNLTGNILKIKSISENRPGDIRIYITDYTKAKNEIGWTPKKKLHEILEEVYKWTFENRDNLRKAFA